MLNYLQITITKIGQISQMNISKTLQMINKQMHESKLDISNTLQITNKQMNRPKINQSKITKSKFNNQAFTIVELLVVIVVIGILASILILGFGGSLARARDSQRSINVKSIAESLEKYYQQNGEYPGCTIMTSSNLNTLSTALYGLNTKVFTMPKYTQNTNSIQCISDIESNNDDIIAYNADTSSSCQTGSGCSYFTLQYREERTREIKTIKSRRGFTPPVVGNVLSGAIDTTSATIGATVLSSGTSKITDSGICWGLSANAITNCQSNSVLKGRLIKLLNPYTTTLSLPVHIAISPDNKSMYVANANSSKVSMYSRNINGELSSQISYDTGLTPYGISVSPDGKSVYITNSNAQSISMYQRDETTGALTPLSPFTISAGAGPRGITVTSDGKNVYAVNNQSTNGSVNVVSMYSRDVNSGLLNPLSTPSINAGVGPWGIAASADGTSVYVVNSTSGTISMYKRNTETGLLTALSTPTIGTGSYPTEIQISKDGKFAYVASNSTGTYFYNRNINTGALTLASSTNGGKSNSLAISDDGANVYATNYDASTIAMYDRNLSNGTLVTIETPFNVNASPSRISVSPDGNFAYVIHQTLNQISMYYRNSGNAIIGVPFLQSIKGLPLKTQIYYRGYATNYVGTGYSDAFTFTTL